MSYHMNRFLKMYGLLKYTASRIEQLNSNFKVVNLSACEPTLNLPSLSIMVRSGVW